jgi:hypothetical protein
MLGCCGPRFRPGRAQHNALCIWSSPQTQTVLTGCFKKGFTTLKAYFNLLKNTPSFTRDSYSSVKRGLEVNVKNTKYMKYQNAGQKL